LTEECREGRSSAISPCGELAVAIIGNEPFVFPVADTSARLKLPVLYERAVWSPDSKGYVAIV
jgi:hypothetical protein